MSYDLKEVRQLAAVVWPSCRAAGYSPELAVDHSLAVAEMLIDASIRREKERERQQAARQAIRIARQAAPLASPGVAAPGVASLAPLAVVDDRVDGDDEPEGV